MRNLHLKRPKKLTLTRSAGHPRTKSASLSCYAYQKAELTKRAAAHNMSVSYYLNHLLWKDWL